MLYWKCRHGVSKFTDLWPYSSYLLGSCCDCSVTKLCPTLAIPWAVAFQASLSFTVSWSLLKFMSIKSMMLFHHIILCCPLLLMYSIFPRVFSNESALGIRWPMCWSFSISLSSEYSGLISFRINWFDILSSKGILSLLQHHNLKASFLWCSAFFIRSSS